MRPVGGSASVRQILSSLPADALAGTGRFSCLAHGKESKLGWRFAVRPGEVVRIDTPEGQPHTIRWAGGRELYDFGDAGPLEVLPESNEAFGWRSAPGVPEIENMLRPRTLDHWMGLREYSMTERSERGRAPWGSPTRIFDLMLGDEHALRVVYDDVASVHRVGLRA